MGKTHENVSWSSLLGKSQICISPTHPHLPYLLSVMGFYPKNGKIGATEPRTKYNILTKVI